MRNLRNKVRQVVQEEVNAHNTSRMLVTEIGDAGAKPYKFTRFDGNLKEYEADSVHFKTDSGLLYVVYLENREMYLDVTFKANGTFDITNRGELYRIMATIIAIVERVFKKSELRGIRYSPIEKNNDGGRGRDMLYRLFIDSFVKKHGLKVEFDRQGEDVLVHLNDPTGKFLMVSLREKLLNPRQYRITKRDLNVDGDLDLSGTNITTLPKTLQVGGDLYLNSCTSLKALPNGLRVGWNLDLNGCTSLKMLPDGLEVDGDLYIEDTPLAKMYSDDEIRDMVEASGGYVGGNIYI